MILVTAAHGNQGRLLVPKLAAAGFKVRGLRRTVGGEAELMANGAAEVVIGELTDPAVLDKAMKGVESVFHVGPSAHPQERELGLLMVQAAQRAGVHHFVTSTVLHPILTKLLQHERKRDVEEALVESGLNFTILQPADFMQSIQFRYAFETGTYRLPWGGDKRQSLVDLEDVTDVAVKVFKESSRHFGATYELSSTDCLSPKEIALIIQGVVGKPIEFAVHDYVEFVKTWFGDSFDREKMKSELATFKALVDWYWAHDFVGNANVLTMLLGRTPTTLRQFIEREYGKRHESYKFMSTGVVYKPMAG